MMKVRKFYPRQVLRGLQGDHQRLTTGQAAALKFCMLKGRKLGLSIVAGPALTKADYLRAAVAGNDAVKERQNAAPFVVRFFSDGSRADGFARMTPECRSF